MNAASFSTYGGEVNESAQGIQILFITAETVLTDPNHRLKNCICRCNVVKSRKCMHSLLQPRSLKQLCHFYRVMKTDSSWTAVQHITDAAFNGTENAFSFSL